MFQYTPAYPSQGANYAFLHQLAYQICYLPPEQMYFIPPNAIQPAYDLPAFNHAPIQIKYAQDPTIHPQIQTPPSTQAPLSKTPRIKSNDDFDLQKNEEQNRTEAKQKFGRNICSNIFHLMVKFIKKQKKMKAVVARIIQQNNLTLKVNEFYQIFKNRSYKLKAYANMAKISEFWKGPSFPQDEMRGKNIKEVQCTKVFRIIGKLYLNYHHLPYVYNSLKIKSQSKRLHMESIRKILSL